MALIPPAVESDEPVPDSDLEGEDGALSDSDGVVAADLSDSVDVDPVEADPAEADPVGAADGTDEIDESDASAGES